MTPNHEAYLLVLASTTAFSFASLLYVDISRRVSPLWMNAVKAIVACLGFSIAVLIGRSWPPLSGMVYLALLASGALGLGIGDVFLLKAYARMGAARTLILYGFQPLVMGVAAHFFFAQTLSWGGIIAVVFIIGCLFIFSLEKFKQDGHWEIVGLVSALIGVLLDNTGVLLSRWCFDQQPAMGAFQANLVRGAGAIVVFLIFGSFSRVQLVAGWRQLDGKGRGVAVLASFMGTFLSLSLYLTAVKIGQLASISALGASGPIISSAMECVYLRRWPSRFLILALVFFLIGFALMNLA